MNLDYKFLLGDLNFRINFANNEVRSMFENYETLVAQGKDQEANEIIAKLLKYDQLITSKKSNDILEKYQEGEIQFGPTYKYDVGTNTFDTGKNLRTPSW